MTEETLDALPFWAWMAAPIALGCAVLWFTRPKRPERDELDEPPTETIEQRARQAHD